MKITKRYSSPIKFLEKYGAKRPCKLQVLRVLSRADMQIAQNEKAIFVHYFWRISRKKRRFCSLCRKNDSLCITPFQRQISCAILTLRGKKTRAEEEKKNEEDKKC